MACCLRTLTTRMVVAPLPKHPNSRPLRELLRARAPVPGYEVLGLLVGGLMSKFSDSKCVGCKVSGFDIYVFVPPTPVYQNRTASSCKPLSSCTPAPPKGPLVRASESLVDVVWGVSEVGV